MWCVVGDLCRAYKKEVGATGFNLSLQDGPSSGQSVPHVHVHVLPRYNEQDFPNDEIYQLLDGWGPWKGKVETVKVEGRGRRELQDMEEEAGRVKGWLGK